MPRHVLRWCEACQLTHAEGDMGLGRADFSRRPISVFHGAKSSIWTSWETSWGSTAPRSAFLLGKVIHFLSYLHPLIRFEIRNQTWKETLGGARPRTRKESNPSSFLKTSKLSFSRREKLKLDVLRNQRAQVPYLLQHGWVGMLRTIARHAGAWLKYCSCLKHPWTEKSRKGGMCMQTLGSFFVVCLLQF